jgi:general stress protein YciG
MSDMKLTSGPGKKSTPGSRSDVGTPERERTKGLRGFSSIDPERQRAIARKSGEVASHKRSFSQNPSVAASAATGQPQRRSGGRFVSSFFDPDGFLNVGRIAEDFGMSKGQLADTIGLKRDTLYRVARLEAPKSQARATEMLEIVGRIADWAGGDKQAMAWYRAEPIAAFGGRTAESLVKEGKAAAVRDYLDHVATGGFA